MGKGKKIFIIVSLILVIAVIASGVRAEAKKKKEAEYTNFDYTIDYVLEDGTKVIVKHPDVLVDDNGNIIVGFVQPDGSIIGKSYTIEGYFKMIEESQQRLKR